VYYIHPHGGAGVATLVTIGLPHAEQRTDRDAGVRDQPVPIRAAAPALRAAVQRDAVSSCRNRCWPNRTSEAARLNGIIRGYPMQSFGILNRQWIIGRNGDLYHYEFFDARANQFSRCRCTHLNEDNWQLDSLFYARNAGLVKHAGADGQPAMMWVAQNGWSREFSIAKPTRHRAERPVVTYAPFAERRFTGASGVFQTEDPEADRMTYGQLKHYIREPAGQRLPRHTIHRAAAAKDRLPVRHLDHDPAGVAVRREDRPERGNLRASASVSSWRSCTGRC